MGGKPLAALVLWIASLACADAARAEAAADPLEDAAVARIRDSFKVDGIALFDPHATHAARMGVCAPSIFAGLKWCVSGTAEEKSGAAAYIKTTGYNIGADNRIVYAISSRRSYPLKREEFEGIVRAIGERYGAGASVYAFKATDEDAGRVDSLIAVWGGIRLVHLTETEYAVVEGGGSLKRGHLVDHRFSLAASAKKRDPVYKIEGEAGFILHLMATSPDRADIIARAVYSPVFLPPGKPSTEAANPLVADTARRSATPGPRERGGDRDAGRAAAEDAARSADAKRIEAERALAAERLLREEAERKAAAEKAARAEAERKAAEERRALEDEKQRAEAERKAAAERAQRAEAELKAIEERRQKEEAERKSAEERAKRAERERMSSEERRRAEEAERRQAEERVKRAEIERKVLEERRRKEEAERVAAEERAQRAEAERKAAEERRHREEAQRKSAEERAQRAEDGRKAAEDRRAAEQKQAQDEAARKAGEETARRAEAERAAEEGRRAVDEGDAAQSAEAARLARERAARPESWHRLAAAAARSAGAIWSFSESHDRVADERTLRSQTIFGNGERGGNGRLAVEVTFECTIAGRDRRLRALARGFDRKSGSGVAFRAEGEGTFGVRTRFTLDDQPPQDGLLFRERQDDTASILELPMISADLGKKAPRAGIWLRHYAAAVEFNLASGTVAATITPYADNLRRVLEACAQ